MWQRGVAADPSRFGGALHLNGEPPGSRPCNTNPLGSSPTGMGYWEYAAAHEVFHLFGAVGGGDLCAQPRARGARKETTRPT